MPKSDHRMSGASKHTSRSRPSPLVTGFKFLLALAPLAWIFLRMDIGQFSAALKGVSWWAVGLIAVIVLVSLTLQGVRWWLLLRAFLPDLPFSSTISAHFKGVFYSIILPTSAAQDVVRAAILSKKRDYSVIWGATWVGRLLGLLALSTLSLTGLALIDKTELPTWAVRAIATSLIVIAVLLLLSFSKILTRHIRLLLTPRVPEPVMRVVEGIRQAVYLFRGKLGAVVAVGLITLAVQMLVVAMPMILILAITGQLYPVQCLFFVPAIEIAVISVPLTPNGLGIREGLHALFLTRIGLSEEQIGVYVMVALLGIVLRVVGGIPVVYDLWRGKKPTVGTRENTVQPRVPEES